MNLFRSFRKSSHKRGKYYRLNYNITAPTVRLLDEEGKQIGVFSRDEALRRARQAGLDLVEIAPLANPPVCKIIDFKKFRYLESKKERDQKKKSKNTELKQIMLSPFIGEHDLLIREKRARQFLKDGNRLKIVVQFKGRQQSKKDFGFEIIDKFINKLSDAATVLNPPHQEGQFIVAQIATVKKGNKKNETENQKGNHQENKNYSQREIDPQKTIQPSFKTE